MSPDNQAGNIVQDYLHPVAIIKKIVHKKMRSMMRTANFSPRVRSCIFVLIFCYVFIAIRLLFIQINTPTSTKIDSRLFYQQNMLWFLESSDNSTILNLERTRKFPQNRSYEAEEVCVWPHLTKYHYSIKEWVKTPAKLNCTSIYPNWFSLRNGWLVLTDDSALVNHSCSYRQFDGALMPNPTELEYGEDVPITEQRTFISKQFFEVHCFAKNATAKPFENDVYRREFTQLLPEHVEHAKPSDEDRLSIDIFVLDSVSLTQTQRQLPRFYRYLKTNDDSWVVFDKPAKISDNTLGNMMAILSGQKILEPNLVEMDNETSDFNVSGIVNMDTDIDFLWKDYHARNCTTMFNIDPVLKAFGFGYYPSNFLHGFTKDPVDYYLRRFYFYYIQHGKPVDYRPDALCRHNEADIDVVFRIFRQWLDRTSDKCHFSSTQALHFYTHEQQHLVNHLETPMLRLFQSKDIQRKLNHSVVLFMGDHGHRLSLIKYTPQGEIEERQAFFALRFPPWFGKKYPIHWKRLKENAKRIVNHWDFHVTLRELSNGLGRPLKATPKRGISLLSGEVPEQRTCEQMDTPRQFCLCTQPAATVNVTSITPEITRVTVAQFLGCPSMNEIRLTSPLRVSVANDFARNDIRHFDEIALIKLSKPPPKERLVFFRFTAVVAEKFEALIQMQHFRHDNPETWDITCVQPLQTLDPNLLTGYPCDLMVISRIEADDLHC